MIVVGFHERGKGFVEHRRSSSRKDRWFERNRFSGSTGLLGGTILVLLLVYSRRRAAGVGGGRSSGEYEEGGYTYIE
jgi:hypothetical protein